MTPGSSRRQIQEAIMRQTIVVGLAALAGLGSVTGLASSARSAGGLLTGTTQISFGCPGPVREGGTLVLPLAPARARPLLGRSQPSGRQPSPQHSPFVLSDAQGRFALRLPAGRYIVSPLPQPRLHTYGGLRLIVQIHAPETTRILVRFEGFPRMA
jgi:hypothetical protein